jgi:hypothetical protein
MLTDKEIIQIIESATYTVGPYITKDIINCISIVSEDNPANVVLEIVHYYLNICNGQFGSLAKAQELCDALKGADQINYGPTKMIYFPRIKFVSDASEYIK